MASDNLMMSAFEQQPWQFRSVFNDTTITSPNDNAFNDLVNSLLNQPPVQTPTISCASENEIPAPKQRRSLPPTGKVSKRKSRASKRSTTTFITADPENFRQMVQEVTGVRLNGETPLLSVIKPEPNRAVNQSVHVGFDASSFLMNGSNNNYNNMVQPTTTMNGDVGVSGFGFESFCSFPTLESWKV